MSILYIEKRGFFMKRTVISVLTLAFFAIITVAAQADVTKGDQLFKQKCAMCHTVKGNGGVVGPDLSKVSARMKEQDIRAKLTNPNKSKPTSAMPSFKSLAKADLDSLITYLNQLK